MIVKEIQGRLRPRQPRGRGLRGPLLQDRAGPVRRGGCLSRPPRQVMHRLAKEYQILALDQVIELLRSPVHEDRLLALLILVRQATKADQRRRRRFTISTWPTPGSSITGTWSMPRRRRSWAAISQIAAASRSIGSPLPGVSGSVGSASSQRFTSFARAILPTL